MLKVNNKNKRPVHFYLIFTKLFFRHNPKITLKQLIWYSAFCSFSHNKPNIDVPSLIHSNNSTIGGFGNFIFLNLLIHATDKEYKNWSDIVFNYYEKMVER